MSVSVSVRVVSQVPGAIGLGLGLGLVLVLVLVLRLGLLAKYVAR